MVQYNSYLVILNDEILSISNVTNNIVFPGIGLGRVRGNDT